jgi:hypothetical protein
MRRALAVALVALFALPGFAGGAVLDATTIASPPVPTRETMPLFAAGGSAVTNGVFFPGTAIYDGYELQGVPYEIAKGTDIEFYTTDSSVTLGNGHQIRSFKNRRNGRPLFMSKFLVGPGSTLMITSHLKPGRGELDDGSYGYFCSVHNQQFGILKIVR